jgi:glycosyltransferase involved in cell wall biosynthesis
MDYVIAVQAPAYATAPGQFAIESAFAAHLQELQRIVSPWFSRVVLVAPSMSSADHARQKDFLGTLDAANDRIVFMPSHDLSMSTLKFWTSRALPLWRQLRALMKNAGVAHSGLSTDIGRPIMALTNLAAWTMKRPVVFISDIDFRKHAWRGYKLGFWGRKNYLRQRLVHDPIKWLQCWLAVRTCDLVLLKSDSMVKDFGAGRPNVRNFFDTVHSADQIVSAYQLSQRQAWLRQPDRPLRIVYFGRLVRYKGIDRVIEAVRIARDKGTRVEFHVIGSGDCLASLQAQVKAGGLEQQVVFKQQVPYGDALFEQLDQCHFSVAAPLLEDTPRSAFDAMARALPILAFDISYFRDLADASGAVTLAQWPSAESFAQQLCRMDKRRDEVAEMAARAVAFAGSNTQTQWLSQRINWTLEVALKGKSFTPVKLPEHSSQYAELD